jgi:hypothetical protein
MADLELLSVVALMRDVVDAGLVRGQVGADVVFNLEVMAEDGEPQVLYAVAVWRGPLEGAVAALENFDEKWWLDQPTRGLALTFTYELV